MNRCFFIVFLLSANIIFAQVSHVQEDVYSQYNTDNFVSQQYKTQSNGDILYTQYLYPKDLMALMPSSCMSSLGADAQGINNLVSKNIINQPVETYSYVVKPSGVNNVISGELYTFYPSAPYPNALYKLEIQVPLMSFNSYHPSSCTFAKDFYYVLQEQYSYDNYGNLIQKQIKTNKYISYIFGYKNTYRTTVVDNATNAEIAYSSFESDQTGFWNYDPTWISDLTTDFPTITPIAGKMAYLLNSSSGNIISRILPAKNYIISFWQNRGTATVVAFNGLIPFPISSVTGPTINGWTYMEYTALNVTSISISSMYALVDEVRLYPQSAQMETVAYYPLIGASYTCDVANHFSYYTYDDLNRLLYIKDQNGIIVKQMEYGIQKTE